MDLSYFRVLWARTMVIVRLMGGLGNQMFEYAAGRRLAHSLGATLKLDTSHFGESGAIFPSGYCREPTNSATSTFRKISRPR